MDSNEDRIAQSLENIDETLEQIRVYLKTLVQRDNLCQREDNE